MLNLLDCRFHELIIPALCYEGEIRPFLALPVFVSGGALVGVVKLLFVQVTLVDAVAAHVPYDYAFLSLRAVSNSLAEVGGVA